MICGRYEGVDERVRQHLVTDEISVGDFVLTGGELAALIIVDAVARLLPVCSVQKGLPQATVMPPACSRARTTKRRLFFAVGLCRMCCVPATATTLHVGDMNRHYRRTWERRPEMLLTAPLDEADRCFLAVLALETAQSQSFENRQIEPYFCRFQTFLPHTLFKIC